MGDDSNFKVIDIDDIPVSDAPVHGKWVNFFDELEDGKAVVFTYPSAKYARKRQQVMSLAIRQGRSGIYKLKTKRVSNGEQTDLYAWKIKDK